VRHSLIAYTARRSDRALRAACCACACTCPAIIACCCAGKRPHTRRGRD